MKKKILAIALIFVMAAAFCACGTEKTPASADGSADAGKGIRRRGYIISLRCGVYDRVHGQSHRSL